MNWLPPTKRFFIGSRHQVQRRSGRSAGDGIGFGSEEETLVMRGIVSDRREPCQSIEGPLTVSVRKKSFSSLSQVKSFVV